jgi:RNA polymerase sigma-70 factor, ECF subfamily
MAGRSWNEQVMVTPRDRKPVPLEQREATEPSQVSAEGPLARPVTEPPTRPNVEPPRQLTEEPPMRPTVEPPRRPTVEPPRRPTVEPPRRLRSLFEEHSSFVWRSLRRLGVADADLDDMMQEVFLVVYHRLADYEERERVRSWLYSICTRVASSQRRKVARRRENVLAEPTDQRVAPTQQQQVEEQEALRLGRQLLELLPAEQREVFVLYEIEHLPMAQIAEALACPLHAAYSRLRVARQKIVAELERVRREGEPA